MPLLARSLSLRRRDQYPNFIARSSGLFSLNGSGQPMYSMNSGRVITRSKDDVLDVFVVGVGGGQGELDQSLDSATHPGDAIGRS